MTSSLPKYLAACVVTAAMVAIPGCGADDLDEGDTADLGEVGDARVSVADIQDCPDGYACVWNAMNYSGTKNLIGAGAANTGWHNWANTKYSAKNRYSNKIICLASGTSGGGNVHCLWPGQKTEYPYGRNSYAVY
jgi:hypothetical protein